MNEIASCIIMYKYTRILVNSKIENLEKLDTRLSLSVSYY